MVPEALRGPVQVYQPTQAASFRLKRLTAHKPATPFSLDKNAPDVSTNHHQSHVRYVANTKYPHHVLQPTHACAIERPGSSLAAGVWAMPSGRSSSARQTLLRGLLRAARRRLWQTYFSASQNSECLESLQSIRHFPLDSAHQLDWQ
jgi:hypothetical protein